MKKAILTAACLCAAALYAVDDAAKNHSTAMNANASAARACGVEVENGVKMLFIGNSITLHGPLASIGWTNNWGMAASAPEKDYVHRVVRGFEQRTGRKASFRVRNLFAFERDIAGTDLKKILADDIAWKPSYVVVALGENTPNESLKDAAAKTLFRNRMAELFRLFLPHANGPKPVVVARGVFWPNAEKERLTREAAEAAGARYVATSDLGRDDQYKAIGLFAHKGVAGHPGDLGMEATAKRILEAFFKPEREVGEVDAEGFVNLFNGRDLTGWYGSTGYGVDPAEPGVLQCFPGKGSGGNLLTEKEYSDFILRFEFTMPPNGNNGLGIRTPSPSVDAAYSGMCELQLLDDGGASYYDEAAKKDKIKPYQYTASVYGVVPVKRDNTGKQIWGKQKSFCAGGSYLRKAGLWNYEEVRVIGSRIQVILNGELVTDADVSAFKGDGDTMDHRKHPGLHNRKGHVGWLGHGSNVKWRNIRIKEVKADYAVGSDTVKPCPAGFTPLFTGAARDLANWKGVTTQEQFDRPPVRHAATPEKRAAMQKIADKGMAEHWHLRDGALFFDGFQGGYSLATAKDYGDFEMLVDWRTLSVTGDSGLYLRGTPQVQIWDAHNQWHIGSGGLYNNRTNPSQALAIADRHVGSWNTFRIRMQGEKVSVWLNGTLVVDNTTLENYWERGKPLYPREQIELQCHGDPLEFKNIFIREL